MKFLDYPIHDSLKQSLSKMGLKRPTDIQYKAIPHILRGEDVMAVAQTGTGKTLAFLIPAIDQLIKTKKQKVKHVVPTVLIMVPTHELCLQITDVVNQLLGKNKIKALAIYGGVSQDQQIKALKEGVHLVIATPGRMFDLISQGYLDTLHVKTLILDEADQMLDRGFYKDIEDIHKKLPRKRQTLFFTATINKGIKKLAYSIVKKAIRIQISPKDPVTKNITHSVARIAMDDKRYFLEKIHRLNSDEKLLVFVRTKVRAERVVAAMERVGIKANALHGDKDQSQRNELLDNFNVGENKLLIATDVSARGIDFKNVGIVINYDLPDDPEMYVHRIGRTGRGKKRGTAIAFCAPREKELLLKIEAFLGHELHQTHITKQDYKEVLELKYDHKADIDSIINEIEELEEEHRKKKKSKRK